MKPYLLVVMLVLSCSAVAAENESDWQNLRELRAGQRIEVVTTNIAKYKGEFVRFDDMGITIVVDKNQRTVAHEQVARVSSVSHRVRNGVLLGLGGLVAGGVAAAARCDGCDRYGWMIPVGMAAGAVTGAAIPSGRTYFRIKKLDTPRTEQR